MRRILTVIGRELREIAPATLFFLIVFHMLALTKSVILRDHRLDLTASAIATVGALIVAKAILIVEQLPVARRFGHRLLLHVLWKACLFGVVATIFRLLEEALTGHHVTVEGIPEAFGGTSWAYFWIMEMWLFAMLLLYTLATELFRAVGPAEMRRLLLGARTP